MILQERWILWRGTSQSIDNTYIRAHWRVGAQQEKSHQYLFIIIFLLGLLRELGLIHEHWRRAQNIAM